MKSLRSIGIHEQISQKSIRLTHKASHSLAVYFRQNYKRVSRISPIDKHLQSIVILSRSLESFSKVLTMSQPSTQLSSRLAALPAELRYAILEQVIVYPVYEGLKASWRRINVLGYDATSRNILEFETKITYKSLLAGFPGHSEEIEHVYQTLHRRLDAWRLELVVFADQQRDRRIKRLESKATAHLYDAHLDMPFGPGSMTRRQLLHHYVFRLYGFDERMRVKWTRPWTRRSWKVSTSKPEDSIAWCHDPHLSLLCLFMRNCVKHEDAIVWLIERILLILFSAVCILLMYILHICFDAAGRLILPFLFKLLCWLLVGLCWLLDCGIEKIMEWRFLGLAQDTILEQVCCVPQY